MTDTFKTIPEGTATYVVQSHLCCFTALLIGTPAPDSLASRYVVAAFDPALKDQSGSYLVDCQLANDQLSPEVNDVSALQAVDLSENFAHMIPPFVGERGETLGIERGSCWYQILVISCTRVLEYSRNHPSQIPTILPNEATVIAIVVVFRTEKKEIRKSTSHARRAHPKAKRYTCTLNRLFPPSTWASSHSYSTVGSDTPSHHQNFAQSASASPPPGAGSY